MGEFPKVLALGAAIAVVASLLVLFGPKLVGEAAGPDVELITALKTAESEGLELQLPGGTLKSKKLSYQRLTVSVVAPHRRAQVSCTLDFTGRLGSTEVSSLGVEKIVFLYDGASWKPQTSLAPRLAAVVSALESRRGALEAANRGALSRLIRATDGGGLGTEAEQWLGLVERKLRVDAWFIRLERDAAQVREQYRLEGFTADRPFRSAGPRRLNLEQSEGEFFFPNGLM